MTPLVLVYGVSLFFVLLDQIEFGIKQLRYVVMVVFAMLVCLPMIGIFLTPKPGALVYPPYNPPAIQLLGSFMKEQELTMSDIPWAMAWYGQRQSVWLTLNARTISLPSTITSSRCALSI